jgi:hypothetical protein
MSLPWCAELMLNPVVRWRVKRRSATHPNLDALTRGLKPHGYLQQTAPRSSKTSKLQSPRSAGEQCSGNANQIPCCAHIQFAASL